jgi:hypothetical protein
MKKEYSIVFEAPGLAGTTNLHPLPNKWKTQEAAENGIVKLLSGNDSLSKRTYYVLPCYSKS